MGLLEKLEKAVNNLLILIGQLIVRSVLRIIPPKAQVFLSKINVWFPVTIVWIKNFPKLALTMIPIILNKIKSAIFAFNFKAKLLESHKAAMAQYASSQPGAKLSGIKKTILTPFLLFAQWLKGLSSAQAALLMTFTAASVLAGINIVFESERLLKHHTDANRTPASVEEEITYDRPGYYKKSNRHFWLTSLRLPVYYANVNELKSIDIDINATMSNRQSRMVIEKLEFQLRDHLILNVEPMVASFPLEDEGKVILREKLIMEINDFMVTRKIDGHVQDLELTYILAN